MSALSEQEMAVVYSGSRGKDFKDLLLSVLELTSLNKKYYSKLLDEEGMMKFSAAFTHPSAADTTKRWTNYEWSEFTGDSIANHSVVEYIALRFPEFDGDSDAVRVGTRVKINTVSKATFCELARSLGFWPFISATMEFRTTKMRPLLEDSFEAFLGTLSHLVDRKIRTRDSKGRVQLGAGFQFCFEIVRDVLDGVEICGGLPNADGVQLGKLRYDDLVDWITQLKELFDLREMQDQFGKVKYQCERVRNPDNPTESRCYTDVFASGGTAGTMRGRLKMGHGTAALQADSKQQAAKHAVLYMRKQGYTRPMRPAYAKFCK